MFVDQVAYKEEWYDGFFTLDDLDDDFYSRVVGASYSRSSGMGGPGLVRMITEENEQYEIGMDMFSDDAFHKDGRLELLDVTASIALYKVAEDREPGSELIFEAEKNGWTKFESSWMGDRILIRNDYVDIFNRKGKTFVDSEDGTLREVLHPFGQIGLYLKEQGKKPAHYLYEGTKKYRIHLQEEWEKYEAEKERVRIRPEDVEWKPIHANNVKYDLHEDVEEGVGPNYRGEYLLLVRADEESGVMAEKWSIVPQWKDRRISVDGEIMCYNLYCKEYWKGGIEGPLKHPEPTKEANEEYERWWTFRGPEINDYGEFIFSHRTIDDAKEEALHHANGNIARGGYNRENLITEYPSKEVEERIIYEKYAPIVLFADRFDEIASIIKNYEYGPNRWGQGWLIRELSDKLGISKEEAFHLKNLCIGDLDSEALEFAKERLRAIKMYDDEKGLLDWPETEEETNPETKVES